MDSAFGNLAILELPSLEQGKDARHQLLNRKFRPWRRAHAVKIHRHSKSMQQLQYIDKYLNIDNGYAAPQLAPGPDPYGHLHQLSPEHSFTQTMQLTTSNVY